MPINRSIHAMACSATTLQALLRDIDEERARTSRDGGNGWNPIEVLCHLYDYDELYRDRTATGSADNPPAWQGYPADELVIQNRYAEQTLESALSRFLARRRDFIAYAKTLTQDDTDQRQGVHPVLGLINVSENLALVGIHDLNHIEQIVRTLGLAERL